MSVTGTHLRRRRIATKTASNREHHGLRLLLKLAESAARSESLLVPSCRTMRTFAFVAPSYKLTDAATDGWQNARSKAKGPPGRRRAAFVHDVDAARSVNGF